MELRLSHIALACHDIDTISAKLQILLLQISERESVPTEKVNTAMVPVSVSKHLRLELLEPTAGDSPVAKFLSKHPHGGVHHLSFEVENLERWIEVLKKSGFEVLPPGVRVSARGRALFIHPRSFGGVLVELEEIHSGVRK